MSKSCLEVNTAEILTNNQLRNNTWAKVMPQNEQVQEGDDTLVDYRNR